MSEISEILIIPVTAAIVATVLIFLIVATILVFIFSWWFGSKMLGYNRKKSTTLGLVSAASFIFTGFIGPIVVLAVAWFFFKQ